MGNSDNEKIIIINFKKKLEEKDAEQRKKEDARIYGEIIKRIDRDHLIPDYSGIEDEPA